MLRKPIFFDILHIKHPPGNNAAQALSGCDTGCRPGDCGFHCSHYYGEERKKKSIRNLDLLGGATLIGAYLDAGRKYSTIQQFKPGTIDVLRALQGIQAVSAIVSMPAVSSSIQTAFGPAACKFSMRSAMPGISSHGEENITLIQVEALTPVYDNGTGPIVVLQGVSPGIQMGKMVATMGPYRVASQTISHYEIFLLNTLPGSNLVSSRRDKLRGVFFCN